MTLSAFLTLGDNSSHLVDDASDIVTHDGGPLLVEDTLILTMPVKRIDGHGTPVKDDLSGACSCERGLNDA